MNLHLHLAASLFALVSGGALAQDPAENDPMTRDIRNPDSFIVVHGDPEKGKADVVVKFAAGSSSGYHWHTTAERMVLLSGELHLTYVGHETMVLKPGSYAYGPARLAHTADCTEEAPCVLFIATELPFDQVPYLAHLDADHDDRVSLAEYQEGLYDFDAMDRDHDQVLSPEELQGSTTRPFTRAEFRASLAKEFASWDRNGDGHLDATEQATPPSAKPAPASTGG